jgi:hypothetical protein
MFNESTLDRLYLGINGGDMGTQPWKAKVNKQSNHKYTVIIFICEQTVQHNKVSSEDEALS